MPRKSQPLPQIPEICDYACPRAAFPPAETAGICRTMAAVWCQQLKELVNKNRPCEWRRREQAGRAEQAGRRPRARRSAGRPRS